MARGIILGSQSAFDKDKSWYDENGTPTYVWADLDKDEYLTPKGLFWKISLIQCWRVDTLKETRLMVARDLGFMPAEGGGLIISQFGGSLVRVPLYRDSTQITRHYCAFWLADRSGYYIEEFACMLKAKFEKQPTPAPE